MSQGIQWRPAVQHWRLDGPAGADLDMLVAVLLNAGHVVECIEPAEAYRVVNGDPVKLTAIAAQVPLLEGVSLAVETPTTDLVVLTASVAPTRPHPRSVLVQGEGAALTFVARAVDAGLHVAADGMQRWRVNGSTAALMNWLAQHVHATTLDETLTAWGLTAAAAAAESAEAGAPVVQVLLPDRRKTTTSVERDDQGQIIGVTQIETDEPHEIDSQPAGS